MRNLGFLGLLLMTACAPALDDRQQGVGFGRPTAPPPQQSTTILPPEQSSIADITETTELALADAEAEAAASAALPNTRSGAISDEQDFGAVSGRESIESDAERRQAMIDQRVEVAPTAIPDRPASTGPNIIEYALSTSHPIGEERYRRSPFATQARHERNCLAYRSDDLAQEAFLRLGGPERDRQVLDPDGDGYACGWNPEVFRQAARSASQ